jgi:hypothetical protein
MRAFRLLFVIMAITVQLFASSVVTLAGQKILETLQSPETITGLISGSASMIVMILLMFGLFLPQFDRMSRHIQVMQAARDIVEKVRAGEELDTRELAAFTDLLERYETYADSPTQPSRYTQATRTTGRQRRVRSRGDQNRWPPSS